MDSRARSPFWCPSWPWRGPVGNRASAERTQSALRDTDRRGLWVLREIMYADCRVRPSRTSAMSCFSSVRTSARSSVIASFSSQLVITSTRVFLLVRPEASFSSLRIVGRASNTAAYAPFSPMKAIRGRAGATERYVGSPTMVSGQPPLASSHSSSGLDL